MELPLCKRVETQVSRQPSLHLNTLLPSSIVKLLECFTCPAALGPSGVYCLWDMAHCNYSWGFLNSLLSSNNSMTLWRIRCTLSEVGDTAWVYSCWYHGHERLPMHLLPDLLDAWWTNISVARNPFVQQWPEVRNCAFQYDFFFICSYSVSLYWTYFFPLSLVLIQQKITPPDLSVSPTLFLLAALFHFLHKGS